MEELDAFEKRLRAVLEEGAETPAVDVRALAGAAAAKAARRRWAWLRWAGCAAAAGLMLACGWFWLAGRGSAEEADGVSASILLLGELDEVGFDDDLEEVELLLAWQDAPYEAVWETMEEL